MRFLLFSVFSIGLLVGCSPSKEATPAPNDDSALREEGDETIVIKGKASGISTITALTPSGTLTTIPVAKDGTFSVEMPKGNLRLFAHPSTEGVLAQIPSNSDNKAIEILLPVKKTSPSGNEITLYTSDLGIPDYDGGQNIDLGDIICPDYECYSENNPSDDLDTDSDGIPDSQDPNADGDNTPDKFEVQDEYDKEDLYDLLGFDVYHTFPEDFQDNVDNHSFVFVALNAKVNPATVTSESFYIENLETLERVPGTIKVHKDGDKIGFNPDSAYKVSDELGYEFNIVLTKNIKTTDGEALVHEFDSVFMIEGGEGYYVEPFAVDIIDLDSDHDDFHDVWIDTDITVYFTDDLDPESLKGNFHILDASGNPVLGDFDVGYDAIHFTPDEDLQPNSTYKIVFESGIKSIDGEALESGFTVDFKTEDDDAIDQDFEDAFDDFALEDYEDEGFVDYDDWYEDDWGCEELEDPLEIDECLGDYEDDYEEAEDFVDEDEEFDEEEDLEEEEEEELDDEEEEELDDEEEEDT